MRVGIPLRFQPVFPGARGAAQLRGLACPLRVIFGGVSVQALCSLLVDFHFFIFEFWSLCILGSSSLPDVCLLQVLSPHLRFDFQLSRQCLSQNPENLFLTKSSLFIISLGVVSLLSCSNNCRRVKVT